MTKILIRKWRKVFFLYVNKGRINLIWMYLPLSIFSMLRLLKKYNCLLLLQESVLCSVMKPQNKWSFETLVSVRTLGTLLCRILWWIGRMVRLSYFRNLKIQRFLTFYLVNFLRPLPKNRQWLSRLFLFLFFLSVVFWVQIAFLFAVKVRGHQKNQRKYT